MTVEQIRPVLPYLRVTDFLDPGEYAALFDWALANEARFGPAKLVGNLIKPEARLSLTLNDLGPSRPVLEAKLRAATPGWIKALRVTPFEPSAVELELAAHNDGAHFAQHVDMLLRGELKRNERMLSAVYYFHRQPKRFTGGALRLHRIGAQPGDEGIDMSPDDNSLIVFPSWGPHEVMPIACPSRQFADSRFAVNCWIHRARP